jgi:hypothetical protein
MRSVLFDQMHPVENDLPRFSPLSAALAKFL